MRDLEQIAVQQLTCGKCKRPPGKRCETYSGATATRTHEVRMRPLRAAWRIGCSEAALAVIEHIERRCDPDRADLDPRGTLEEALGQVKCWFPA